jgi:hypothetical protein
MQHEQVHAPAPMAEWPDDGPTGLEALWAAVAKRAIKDYLKNYRHPRHADARAYLEWLGILDKVHKRYGIPTHECKEQLK